MEKIQQTTEDYCWSRIGIWSKETPSCPKLIELVHCHNCDVYHSGAKLLLKTAPPDGYLEEWANELSSAKEVDLNLSNPVLVFRLEEEWLALPVVSINMISRPSPVHRIPGRSDTTLLGLANIKGSIELCFSMKNVMKVESLANTKKNESCTFERFVGVGKTGDEWYFPVDEISGIIRYSIDDTSDVPATVMNSNPCYIASVFKHNGKNIGLLDIELILEFLKRRST